MVSLGYNELTTEELFVAVDSRYHAFILLWHDFDGLVQERRNSSALAMELRLSCTNPSIYYKNTSTKASWSIEYLLWGPWDIGRFLCNAVEIGDMVMGVCFHSDVTWASWHLELSAMQLFVQKLVMGNKNGNIKARHYCSLWGEYKCGFPHKGPVMRKAFPCHDVIHHGVSRWWRVCPIWSLWLGRRRKSAMSKDRSVAVSGHWPIFKVRDFHCELISIFSSIFKHQITIQHIFTTLFFPRHIFSYHYLLGLLLLICTAETADNWSHPLLFIADSCGPRCDTIIRGSKRICGSNIARSVIL